MNSDKRNEKKNFLNLTILLKECLMPRLSLLLAEYHSQSLRFQSLSTESIA